MSPKNSINNLKAICLKKVASHLILALSDDEGLHYEVVQTYLSDATIQVLQDLLKYILSNENLDAATRFSCLQLLLRENVPILETGLFPHSYYQKIINLIIEQGLGLQQLSLKGVWIHDQPDLLVKLLEKLKNLKVLVMPHISEDFVLQSPVCQRLAVLDIAGDCSFSAQVLKDLKSTSIKVLDIGSYGKKSLCYPEDESCTVLAALIENLPNLTNLRTYSFVGDSLLEIYKGNPFFKTKLVYIHDTETTVDAGEAIVSLCPNLNSIYLDTPEEGVLNLLTCLKLITSLKLTRFNYSELITYLQQYGSQIQTLKLCNCKERQLDLSTISLLTQELINLDCYKLNLTLSNPECYFMCLQTIDILYCNVNDFIVKCLLTNCPFLQRIVIGDVLRITDGDLFRICAESEFLYLEDLWFSCAKCLTSTSVLLLMGHCPKLRSLGQINGWDLSAGDIDYIRTFIFTTNTDLVLLPTTFP